MGKIAIVTDSTCDLESEILEEFKIEMVPLQVRVDGNEYLDKIDITPQDFLDLMEKSESIPSTSQPAVGDFLAAYEKLAKEYDLIISLHISQQLSGTYKSANLAANMVDGVEIKVIDSETVTAPLGLMVKEVAKAVKEGKNIEEVLELIETLKKDIKIYFTVDELDYLEKGGRIGKAAAFLGGLFNVRPLLSIENGIIIPYKKVRGEKRLFNNFKDIVEQELGGKEGRKLIILHGKYLDYANKLKDTMLEEFSWEEVEMVQLGPVVAAHIGPTPFGVIILK